MPTQTKSQGSLRMHIQAAESSRLRLPTAARKAVLCHDKGGEVACSLRCSLSHGFIRPAANNSLAALTLGMNKTSRPLSQCGKTKLQMLSQLEEFHACEMNRRMHWEKGGEGE